MLPLGTIAPDFTLPDPTGSARSLDDIAGAAGTLVVFVSNHCPYVKHIGPTLGARAGEWQAKGIGIVGINANDATIKPADAPELMGPQAAEWGWQFPYLVDESQDVARAYRAACTPDFFLFGPDRTLAYRGRFDGATPGNTVPVTGTDLDAAITALIAGETIADQIHSVGCGIKWRE